MAEITITISPKFVERMIFIVIILLLLILLISKYVSDTGDCACDEDTTPVITPPVEEDDTPPVVETETEPDPEPEPEPDPEPSNSLSGKLEVALGKITFDLQDDGRAKLEEISVTIKNGLDDDVLLFATINIYESGNQDVEVVNPFWDKAEVPLVKSGETKIVKIDPNKAWPPGVEDGDTISIEAEFTDFQGDIEISAERTQSI